MNNLLLFNDTFISRSEARIDIDDRGYQFGDGIYEVARIYHGKFFMLEEHLVRLWRSAGEMRIRLEVAQDALRARLQELLEKNGIDTGTVYIQVTRGVYPRVQEFPPADRPAQILAYCRTLPRPKEKLEKGVSAKLADDIRWLRCDIKSLNLIPNILARQSAAENQYYEAIQHRNGTVTEGAFSNVYMISRGTVFTHPATNYILNGITRQKILDLCSEEGVSVQERAFSVEELLDADEVFISSTTNEVMPVVRVDDRMVSGGEPGEVTRRLQAAYERYVKKTISVDELK